MRTQRILFSALILAMPLLAEAGVVAGEPGLPSVAGYPAVPTTGKITDAQSTASSAATASTRSAQAKDQKIVVPSIHLSPAALAHQDAQKVWQQSIATPPEGEESPETEALAKQTLAASRQADVTPPVISDADGAVTSVGGRPVLVCSPLHTCVIALPVGTKPVTTVGVSPAEWQVNQAMVGKQPEVFLTPKFAGLHQNIIVAATTKAGKAVNYQVRIVSDKNRYVPVLEIADTNGDQRRWAHTEIAGLMPVRKPAGKTIRNSAPVLPMPLVPVAAIHTNWTIRCGGGGWFSASDCSAIRPLRVYDDGTHTFIQMPTGLASHGGFPIVQAFNRTDKEIGIDTQIRGHLIALDSVPHKIKLRLGHEVVTIERGAS